MTIETELKLQVLGNSRINLKNSSWLHLFTQQPPVHHHVLTTYFDTPGLLLSTLALSLRLRQIDQRWYQTLKSRKNVSTGLHQRNEWEYEIPGPNFNFELFHDTPLQQTPDFPNIASQLVSLFSTDFYRDTWLIELKDKSLIELAYDDGHITENGTQLPIHEIELELKSGNKQNLYLLGSSLCQSLPLRHANTSKAERGYELLIGKKPASAQRAGKLGIIEQMNVSDALQHIVTHSLQHLTINEKAVLEGPDDTEGIHQIRVATRRIRSSLDFYSTTLPKKVVIKTKDKIKWITNELAEAREWDVFITETISPLIELFPNNKNLRRVDKQSNKAREMAYKKVKKSLRKPIYSQYLFDLYYWTEGGSWREQLDKKQAKELAKPIRPFADNQLEEAYTRVLKKANKFYKLTVRQRHQLRLDCKKLRYTSEFFQELYLKEQSKPFILAISRLQSSLGVLNDMASVKILFKKLDLDIDNPASQLITGWVAGTANAELATLKQDIRHFLDQEKFWNLKN